MTFHSVAQMTMTRDVPLLGTAKLSINIRALPSNLSRANGQQHDADAVVILVPRKKIHNPPGDLGPLDRAR